MVVPQAQGAAPEPAAHPAHADADAAPPLSQNSADIVLVSDDDEEVQVKAAAAVKTHVQHRAQPAVTGLQDACGPVEDTQVIFNLREGLHAMTKLCEFAR